MKIDNLLIFFIQSHLLWPGNSTWQNDVIPGRVDRLAFSLRCEIQILVQCRSRFYVFYKNINY